MRAFFRSSGAKDDGNGIVINPLEVRVESKDLRKGRRAIGDDGPGSLKFRVGPPISPAGPCSFRTFDSAVTVEVRSPVDRHRKTGEPPDEVSPPIKMVINWPGRHASFDVRGGFFGVGIAPPLGGEQLAKYRSTTQ